MTRPRLFLHAWSLRYRLRHDQAFGFDGLVARAVADGFDGIGINFNGPQGQFLDTGDGGRVQRAAETLRKHGLDCDLETTGTDPRHLAAQLDLAVAFGAGYLHTYSTHTGTRAEMLDATIRDLVAIGPLAEERGVPVLIENHEEFTGVEIARILEAVNHPHIGALFDYGNSMMVREDPFAALEAMLPWVRGAHMKDHVVMDGKICGVPIGEGVLPIAETTRRLADAGMTRISFENVWSYTSGFHPREDGLPEETDASPIFAPCEDPRDAAFFLPEAGIAFGHDPARVVALEEDAYQRAAFNVGTPLADV